jgi:hypothetical protein
VRPDPDPFVLPGLAVRSECRAPTRSNVSLFSSCGGEQEEACGRLC